MPRIDELDIELEKSSDLKLVTVRASTLLRDLSDQLEVLAEEAEIACGSLPAAAGPDGGLFSAPNSYARAKLVARHLRAASRLCRAAARESRFTWRSFVRNFAPELGMVKQGRPVKTFELDEVA